MRGKFHRVPVVYLLLLSSCAAAGKTGEEKQPSLAAAQQAFEQYDLSTSRHIYADLAAQADASLDDRVAAYRALAVYDWKFERNLPAATRRINAAMRLGSDLAPLLRLLGEIRLEAGEAQSALDTADMAIEQSTSAPERLECCLLYAKAALELAIADAVPPDGEVTQRAAAFLEEVLTHQPARPEAGAALLGIAVLRGDGEAAVRAWKSYFLITDASQITPVLQEPFAALLEINDDLKGHPLNLQQREALAKALAQSRFYRLAARVAEPLDAASPLRRELLVYTAFLNGLQRVNDDFYPRVARGLRNYQHDYDAAVYAHCEALWRAVPHDRQREPFASEPFFDLIRKRFGAEGYIGTTVNFHGMLLGHIIQDETRRVEQYGLSSDFRYVLIDLMASRDFTSWYGTTNVGGWGSPSAMFQVRAAYLAEPFERLKWVIDIDARAGIVARIQRLSLDDRHRCGEDQYAEPASLPLRLKLRASEQLFKQLRGDGLTGQGLSLAFISETVRLNVESTVFAHEGRHSLDQKFFPEEFAQMTDDERELRAKLSEVAFASDPKLALTGSILGGQLDETSGHGLANRRFRILLVDWMRTHANEIAGLDRDTALIMQLDLLSDEQLLQIVREADPLATRTPG